MIQEPQELLLKDICARLPYEVVSQCKLDASYDTSFDTVSQIHKFDAKVYGIKEDLLLVTPLIEDNDEQTFAEEEVADGVSILDFTPYLFQMSSMTEEQWKEITDIQIKESLKSIDSNNDYMYNPLFSIGDLKTIDWPNAHHFDYRNLINKNLAIDCTNLNIY